MSQEEYIGIHLLCSDEIREIMIAELGEIGVESMLETEDGIDAFLPVSNFEPSLLDQLMSKYQKMGVSYSTTRENIRNWNEEWEKNYDPIVIEDQCLVRATFHSPRPEIPYELIITPRMSFGTGHHPTTYLMVSHQLTLDHKDKRVLDAGCGTAILGIMAEKRGAREVIAFDISSWTIENAPENLTLNKCHKTTILEGTIKTLSLEGNFDIILANINKNVLMDEIPVYASYLVSSGVLMMSGFYVEDDADIIKRAEGFDLHCVDRAVKDQWSSLIFYKK